MTADPHATDAIVDAHQALLAAEVEVSRLRDARDEAIRAAVAGGVTAYKVAQELGMSQQQIGRIVKAG